MINWGDIVHQEYATPTDVEDDVIQEVDRTNAVYTRGGNIEKIDDFKYDKVYFGSPYKMSNPMKLDGPLFVSPFPGIASIFSVRPQKDAMKNKYGIPVEKVTNRGYDEWNRNKIDELKKGPIKELHVRLKGITDMEPIEDIVHGYLGEITITDELKEHIYQSAKMHKVFEYCIDHIDSVSFSDIKEVEIKMYITGETPRKTVGESVSFDDIKCDYFVQESAIDRVKSKIADIDEEIAELEDMLKNKPNDVSIENMLEDAKKRKRRWEGELEDLLDDNDNRATKDTKPKPSIRYDSSSGMNVFTINKNPQNDTEFNKIYGICKKMKESVNNNQWSSFESNASAFFKNINISDYESRRMMLNTVDRDCVQIWFTNAEKKIDPNNMRFFHCSHNSSITELKPTHINAGKTIVYPCNAVFFIAISKSDNIDRILRNFKMYGGNVYEYTPSSSDIIYTDSKERRENGIPAVFIKTDKPLKVNKYQTKTVSESFSLDDVEDDFFIESAFSYDKTMEACQELHKEWSKFGYGIPINGKLTNVSSGEEFCKNYRFLSPEDFEKYNGGVCWDFVEWGAKFLRSKGVTFHQYYIQTDTPPNYDTHTFIVCQCGDKFIYPESAFGIIEKDINGVGTFESLPEIFNYVASKIFECNNNRSRFTEFKFSVQEYTQTPNYGCTCEEYMDFMKEHAHLIFEGIAHPIDHANGQDAVPRNIQEAKLTTTKRDKLKDSEFGIPEKRTFPLNDKNHVEAAVRMFPHADASDKEALAKRILRKAHEFGMDTSGWDSINKYVVQEGMFDSIELAEIPYVTASSGHKPVTVDESQMNPFALFDKIPINDYTVNRYKSRTDDMAIGLKHLRVNDNVRGFIWLNQQDEVVGYVAVEKQDIGPFIIALELSPKYQGKGLGKALLEFAENYLGGRYLSVSKNNTHAFEMYKKCGWVVYDETPYMYFIKKDDNIVQPVVQEGAWQDIKNGVNPKSKKLFFHVSMDTKMNGKTLKPRIPTYLTKKGSVSDTYKEDSTIPRVCFSPSIEGCLNAIISAQKNLHIVGEKMFVYIPEKPISEYKVKTNKEIIKEKLVFDANATGEIWILEPVKLKLYGVIMVDQVKNIRDKPTINGDPHCRCDYKWHWAVTPKYVDRTLEYQVTYDEDSSKKKKTTKE